MPADFDSGFFVRKPAWHGMGVVLDEAPESWAEARKAASLEWEPVIAPVYGFQFAKEDGTLVFDPDAVDPSVLRMSLGNAIKNGVITAVETKRRTVRSDTGFTLGVPSDVYEVINHDEIGSIIEAVSAQPNARYETTVSLDGGRAIAAVMRLDEPVVLPGDNSMTLPYMTLTTRHDGSGSCRALATSVRVVCSNTMSAAESEADRNGTVFVFSHTKNWRDHLEEAKQAVAGLRTDFAEYVTFASHLAKIKVSEEQTADYLAEFIPMPMTSVEVSPRVQRHIEEARGTWKAILGSATCATVNGTAYGLLQASTEYLDWYRGYRNQSTLFNRQMLRPEQRKVEAVRLIHKVIGD